MTHRSQERKTDHGKLLIHNQVHNAIVTMVTRLELPSKPKRALEEFWSQRQKQRGLASVQLWNCGYQENRECGKQHGGGDFI